MLVRTHIHTYIHTYIHTHTFSYAFVYSCKGMAAANCKMILDENGIKKDDWWIYTLILLLLFVSFRVLAAHVLIANARRFY